MINRTSANRKRRSTTGSHGMAPNFIIATTTPTLHHRLYRPTTTATFRGQKRCSNDIMEDNRLINDLIIHQDDEQQRLVQACVKPYRLSLPAMRYQSCCYYRSSLPANVIKANGAIEDQHRNIGNDYQYENPRHNSIAVERCQPSVVNDGNPNVNMKLADLSKSASSVENNKDDDHRRLHHRNQAIRISKPSNSSRYSQHAIAQFMHERRKACLRRNQKASRMLGMKKIETLRTF